MSEAREAFDREFLSPWTPEEHSALLEAVDESDYSLADWLEALGAFDAWLAARDEKRRPWREIVGYIDCCAAMAAPGIALRELKVIVIQSLTDFGFRFIEESQD